MIKKTKVADLIERLEDIGWEYEGETSNNRAEFSLWFVKETEHHIKINVERGVLAFLDAEWERDGTETEYVDWEVMEVLTEWHKKWKL